MFSVMAKLLERLPFIGVIRVISGKVFLFNLRLTNGFY
jgi:hypothetical protein